MIFLGERRYVNVDVYTSCNTSFLTNLLVDLLVLDVLLDIATSSYYWLIR